MASTLGAFEGPSKVFDLLSVAMKQPVVFGRRQLALLGGDGLALFPLRFDNLDQFGRYAVGKRSSFFVFRLLRREPNDLGLSVDLSPNQCLNLSLGKQRRDG